jgi:hypothetical protein
MKNNIFLKKIFILSWSYTRHMFKLSGIPRFENIVRCVFTADMDRTFDE